MRQTPRSSRGVAVAIGALRLDRGFEGAPGARDVATAAAVAFGVSLGLQITWLLILAAGPLAEPFAAAELTDMGRKNMRPEHDLPAFYAGCLATLALAWLAVRAAGARLAGRCGAEAERTAQRAAWFHTGLAVASLAGFAALAVDAAASIGADPRLAPATLARLALPGLAALAGLAADHLRACRHPPRSHA